MLVASRFVLTAAHCFDTPPAGGPLTVLFNNLNPQTAAALRLVTPTLEGTSPPVITYDPGTVKIAPGYQPLVATNDVAIIELDTPVPRTLVAPRRVASGSPFLSNALVRLVANGPTGPTSGSGCVDTLAPMFLDGVISSTANSRFRFGGQQIGSQVCNGDSGGPYFLRVAAGGLPAGTVISLLSQSLGADNYGPMLHRTTLRTWLTTNALNSDGDASEAYADICDTSANNQDTDADGLGDYCDDPCPGDGGPLADEDADGVLDCKDLCEGQPDTDDDGDGITDCVDPCVGPDADGDTVCDSQDNCASVHNPNQANSNYLAEYGRNEGAPTPSERLGDACEPVPIALAEAIATLSDVTTSPCLDCPEGSDGYDCCEGFDGSENASITCGAVERNRLDVRFVGQQHTGNGQGKSAGALPTTGRFCQVFPEADILCASVTMDQDLSNDDFDDDISGQSECFSGCADPEVRTDRLHRMTFTTGGPSSPDGSVSAMYSQPAGRASTPTSWTWDYAADTARWLAPEPPLINPAVTSGRDLRGVLALRTQTNLGGPSDALGYQHQDRLNNRHLALAHMPVGAFDVDAAFPSEDEPANEVGGEGQFSPYQEKLCTKCSAIDLPDFVTFDADAGTAEEGEAEPIEGLPTTVFEEGPPPSLNVGPLAAVGATTQSQALEGAPLQGLAAGVDGARTFVVWRKGEAGQSAYSAYGRSSYEHSVLFSGPRGLLQALRPDGGDCNGDLLADISHPRVAGLLQSGRWASSSEPTDRIGAGSDRPIAVGLFEGAASTDLGEALWFDGAKLASDADRGIARTPGAAAPPVRGAALVYSRARNGVFVVGGNDIATGRPRGRIWFRGLEDLRWRVVSTTYRPSLPLAATFDPFSSRLFVLDEVEVSGSGGTQLQAWLIQLDLLTGDAVTLQTWVRNPAWDFQALTVDLDGTLLLTSGSTSRGEHAVARLQTQPTASPIGRMTGSRDLAVPVVPDPAGYTLVLRRAGAEHRVDGVRFRSLPLAFTTWRDVGLSL